MDRRWRRGDAALAGFARASPKLFLPLFGARSTFQDTLLRVSDKALFDRPIVITNAAYIEADILLEPVRRDSGPAIAVGAVFAQIRDSEAIVLALAADNVVRDNERGNPRNGSARREQPLSASRRRLSAGIFQFQEPPRPRVPQRPATLSAISSNHEIIRKGTLRSSPLR